MPFVSRTRATFPRAEFGFFGVVVYTRMQTPRRCGAARTFLRPWLDLRPGVDSFFFGFLRPLRTSWLMLGMRRRMLAAVACCPGVCTESAWAGLGLYMRPNPAHVARAARGRRGPGRGEAFQPRIAGLIRITPRGQPQPTQRPTAAPRR